MLLGNSDNFSGSPSLPMTRFGDFWKGKRVFMTGHTGFKGGWLSIWLKDLHADLTGFSLPPSTKPNLFDLARVGSGINSIIEDIRDAKAAENALFDARPEIVFHLASQAVVPLSYERPTETYETNVMGLVNLLEAVRKSGTVRAVVVVTSDKCYDNRADLRAHREDDPMGGYDPYSSSKGCAELIISAYRSSFFNQNMFIDHGVALASARAGNVIGGGDWAENRLIPDIIRALELRRPVAIRSPRSVRPWQHVLEPLRGYLMLAQMLCEHGPEFASGWNFGPRDDEARPVQWVAEELTQLWGYGATWAIAPEKKQFHESQSLRLDCSKAHAALGWRPLLTLEQTLAMIHDWYKSVLAGGDALTLTLSQIKSYQSLHARGHLEPDRG
jgi:CDP-glucose 4,6-dehydratase